MKTFGFNHLSDEVIARFVPNPVWVYLDGREYILNGVHGHFRHTAHGALYPYPYVVEKLEHEPSERGMRSKHYRETRARLGDDWSTDLSQAIEEYCEIAIQFGYDDDADF
jgi:hypothetical protein